MELARLIEGLSNPAAYPGAPARVEMRQTHISVVFLVDDLVYKIKKPVTPDFLDFGTLEKRHHFCAEEVRLNRRLAAKVYRGVVPVTRQRGELRMGGEGEVVEWAVHMERLPDDARLGARARRGEIQADTLLRLGATLARFHAAAEGGPEVARLAHFDGVARNLRDILALPDEHVGAIIERSVLERLRVLTEEALERHRALIDARADRGVPRDCHGDLHLEHIYLFPERRAPDDLVIIDCIEFNPRFRYIDPVADMAFLYMDLIYQGREDLAEAFRQSYFAASGDGEGEILLPLYTSYRAAVRGNVEGMKWAEPEVPPMERAAALASASGHWLRALGALEERGRRPCIVLVGGLPGTGKSTLARALGAQAGFEVIRSDAVRKDLARAAGLSEEEGRFGEAIYTQEWNDRAYAECLKQAHRAVREGRRVLVDATFQTDRWRHLFLDGARVWGVPAVFFDCQAGTEVVQERLRQRRGDISDADWEVYRLTASRWEEAGELAGRHRHAVGTDQGVGVCTEHAVNILRERGLF